jgi:LysR family transcriptional regulator, glycine cleavage system transcriptional activator
VKRTHLPLNALRVFDAAARHLSFTRAADELAVTPAAVGQQIRALEDVLGVVLFRRTPKGLELTVEAEAGLEALRAGFLKFEEAVEEMQAGQSSKSLTIAAPRDLTARWLAPKLARIAAADPDLRFTLIAADQPLDFTEANLDLAIRWTENANGLEGVAIAAGEVTHIAPADGEGAFRVAWCPEDNAPNEDDRPVMRVGDAGLAIDAVINGLGTALVPTLLAVPDIAAGHIRALGTAPRISSYWLVAPTPQWRQKKVKALVEALLA